MCESLCEREIDGKKFKDMLSPREFYNFLRDLIHKMIMSGLRIGFNNTLLTSAQSERFLSLSEFSCSAVIQYSSLQNQMTNISMRDLYH